MNRKITTWAELHGIEPTPTPQPLPPMRCARCFYILDHLETRTCPECGLSFDPADESTFTRRRPFVWWTFWLPAFVLAIVTGILLFALLVPMFGYTASTTLAISFAIGGIAGYGSKTKAPGAAVLGTASAVLTIGILALGGIGGLLTGLFDGNPQNVIVGGFCGFILAGLAILPALTGALFGYILKVFLRTSSFSQRDYLSLLILAGFTLLPVGLAALEGRHDLLPITAVQTTATMKVPPETAWRSIQFFEQVRRPVPWLLWLSPELRPVSTSGRSQRVGDVRTCTYERGHLVKLITEVIPNRRLAFRVVRQDQIETRGVVLLDGSFDLTPTDHGHGTVVRLTTRYRPLLYPRFAYAWSEAWAVHTLHGHVLAGMNDLAAALLSPAISPAAATPGSTNIDRKPSPVLQAHPALAGF